MPTWLLLYHMINFWTLLLVTTKLLVCAVSRELVLLNRRESIVTSQWLKLHLPSFHTFYANFLPLRPSAQAAKFPTILDRFLLVVYCITQVPTWMDGWGWLRLAKPSFGHQTACTDCHCASEKQPVKADYIKCSLFWMWNLVVNSCTTLFMVKNQ